MFGPLAAIPSPSQSVVHLGPLTVHAYGVCIALGVVAALWLSSKRWVARGGNADDIAAIGTFGVPAGIVGARIYHVLTDWELYRHDVSKVVAIWDGGLGIWGGIAAGVGAGLLVAKRRNLPLLTMLDVAAPALPLAQAIGRLGNYFNQELFGRPTSLPWGLEIDPLHRPEQYFASSTFHPTFLYEMLWNLLLCVVLLRVDARKWLRPGQLFALYVAGYTLARFFIEHLRVEYAHEFLGLRVNEWTSLLLLLTACGFLVVPLWRNRRHNHDHNHPHNHEAA
jgi:prolipoprotein diacylglyceryl transferase